MIQKHIPRNIINILKRSDPNTEQTKLPKLLLHGEWKDTIKIKSRVITEYLNSKSTTEPDLTRISRAIDINIDTEKKINLFKRLFKLKLDPYSRQFQFRLLNNNIYLNRRLYKFKVVDSPRSSFCLLELESLEHFYLKCTKTRQIWTDLERWWRQETNTDTITLTDERILIGTTEDIPHAELLDVLLIDANIELYHARKNGNPPDIKKITNKFTNRRKTEEINARKNRRLQQYKVKWSPFLTSP